MAYYMYILQSEKNGKYYIGSTQNVEERLQQHNWSRTPSTKSGIPWKLVYSEEFEERPSATQREYEIKQKKSRKYIQFLINSVG
ncbi:GIY-YIG nuclease family protein [Draconibacterium mangrovi]|uniref:GIY-YIG nuclease family protein n=1 Tax=Draconibacterium mangrovi TaxID=2697469 RepID=UPI0013D76D0B|nr:GIY-YIG nuclease family protein [Draconibacterium mangrovi]